MYKLKKYQTYSDYNSNIANIPRPNVSKVFKSGGFDVKYNPRREGDVPGLTLIDYIQTDGNCWITTDIDYSTPFIVGSYYITDLPETGDLESHSLFFSYASQQSNYCKQLRIQKDGGEQVNMYSVRMTGNSRTTEIKLFGSWNDDDVFDKFISIKYDYNGHFAYIFKQTMDPTAMNVVSGVSSSDTVTNQESYLTIMGEINDGSHIRQMKSGSRCYGFDIYDSSSYTNKVYSLKPAIYNGSIGLYDIINNKFYGNSGTGTLTAGYNPSLTLVDYIETDGNCIITTDFSNPTRYFVGSFGFSTLPTLGADNDWRVMFAYSTGSSIYYAPFARIQFDGNGRINLYYRSLINSTSGYDYISYFLTEPFPSGLQTLSIKYNGSCYISNSQTLNPSQITNSYATRNSITTQSYLPGNLSIFGSQTTSTAYPKLAYDGDRCYGFDTYYDGSFTRLMHSLRPAIYYGTTGLYDTVNGKFYSNSGTGVLRAGLSNLTLVDYIQTDGNCIIETDIHEAVPYTVSSWYFSQLPTTSNDGSQWLTPMSCSIADGSIWDASNIRVQNDGQNRVVLYEHNVDTSGNKNDYYAIIGYSNTESTMNISLKTNTNGWYYDKSITLNPASITTASTHSANSNWDSNYNTDIGNWCILGFKDSQTSHEHYLKSGSKFYGIDFYSDNTYTTITHSLRPAIYDDEIGLYDLVTNKFYRNSGTGILSSSPTTS